MRHGKGSDENSDRTSPASLRAWLLEEGYPLEMWAAAQMRSLGFLANQSTYFEDPRTKEHREIDLSAGREESFSIDGKPKGLARWWTFVECKLSRDPWIVFVADDFPQRFFTDLLRPSTPLGDHLISAAAQSTRLCGFDAEVHGYGLVRRPSETREKGAPTEAERRDPAYSALKKLAAVVTTELSGNFRART